MEINERTPERSSVPYAEKKLGEMLTFACEQLYPADGFRLELDGITPTPLVHKELEARTGYALDTKHGAKIELAYDSEQDALVLESLRHPLSSQPTMALVIQRMEHADPDKRYVEYLDTGKSQEETQPRQATQVSSADTEHILNGYHLGDIPHPDHDSYRLWRANLFSLCTNGWKTSEYVNLFTGITQHNSESIEISQSTEYTADGNPQTVRTIARTYDMFDDTGAMIQKYADSAIELETPFSHTVRLRRDVAEIKDDPKEPGKQIVGSIKSERIPLDEDSFNGFAGLIEDATLALRQTRAES
jgi:hypothetical protein